MQGRFPLNPGKLYHYPAVGVLDGAVNLVDNESLAR